MVDPAVESTFSTWNSGGILPVAARHSQVAQNELREERQVESDEHDQRGQTAQPFGIHAAGNLRPPEMHAAQIAHDRAAHHDVVEVGDHEIGVGDVHVDAQRTPETVRSGRPW